MPTFEDERPSAGSPPTLTRREARAREAAAAATRPGRGVSPALPDPDTIIMPTALAPVEPPAEAVVGLRRRAASVPKKTLAHRRASVRVGRAVRSAHTSPKRATTIGSQFISLGALVIAGALLVGSSVPINVLGTEASAAAAPDLATARSAGQTLLVPASGIAGATMRDSFDAISGAEVLALKYSGADYSYSVTSGAVRWPFPYTVPITDGFGPRASGFHKGTDFVPGEGAPIHAIADGVAVSSGYDDSGYGNHVIIQHNLGGVNIKSNYAHMAMDSSPIVAGEQIKVGDFLGLVGDTGISYGAHLHFEIYIDDVPVDPFEWLQANAINN